MTVPAPDLKALCARLFPDGKAAPVTLDATMLQGLGSAAAAPDLFMPLLGLPGPSLTIAQIAAPPQVTASSLTFAGTAALFGGRLSCGVTATFADDDAGGIGLTLACTPDQGAVPLHDLLRGYGLVPATMTDPARLPAMTLAGVSLLFDSAAHALSVTSAPAPFPLAAGFAPLAGLLPDTVSLALDVSVDPATALKTIDGAFEGEVSLDAPYGAQILFPLGLRTCWQLDLMRGTDAAASVRANDCLTALFSRLLDNLPSGMGEGLGLDNFTARFFPEAPEPHIYGINAIFGSAIPWTIVPGLATLRDIALSCAGRGPAFALSAEISGSAEFRRSQDSFALPARMPLPDKDGSLTLNAAAMDETIAWPLAAAVLGLDAKLPPAPMAALQDLMLNRLDLDIHGAGAAAKIEYLSAGFVYGQPVTMPPAVGLQAGASLDLSCSAEGTALVLDHAGLTGATQATPPAVASFVYETGTGWQLVDETETDVAADADTDAGAGDMAGIAPPPRAALPATSPVTAPATVAGSGAPVADPLQTLYHALFPGGQSTQPPAQVTLTAANTSAAIGALFGPLLGIGPPPGGGTPSLVITGIMSIPPLPAPGGQFSFSGSTVSVFNGSAQHAGQPRTFTVVNATFSETASQPPALTLQLQLQPASGDVALDDLLNKNTGATAYKNYNIIPASLTGGFDYPALSLPDVSFQFDSETLLLGIESSALSSSALQFPALSGLLPANLTVGLDISIDPASGAQDVDVVLSGDVTLGSVYTVQLGIPIGLSTCWWLQIAGEEGNSLSLECLPAGPFGDIVTVLEDFLPEALCDNIELDNLYVSFFLHPSPAINTLGFSLQTSKPWVIKKNLLTVENIYFSLSTQGPHFTANCNGLLQGSARIGNDTDFFTVGVSIPIPPADGLVTVTAQDVTIEKVWGVLTSVFGVSGDMLPPQMHSLATALTLNFIELQIKLGTEPSLEQVSFSLQYNDKWACPWFSDVYLQSGADISMTLQRGTDQHLALNFASLSGVFVAGQLDIGLCLARAGTTGGWGLAITSNEITLPSISDLATFAGGGVLEGLLPAGIRNTGNFALSGLTIDVQTAAPHLQDLSFILSYSDTSPQWSLIPGYLAIDSFIVAADVKPQPAGGHAFSGAVSGTLTIAGAALYLQASRAVAGDPWVFKGSTIGTLTVQLQDIASHFDLPGAIVNALPAALSVTQMDATIVPSTGAFSTDVAISLPTGWPFAQFSLQTAAFSISRTKQDIEAALQASVALGTDVTLDTRASYDSNSGWYFNGSLADPSGVTLAHLLSAFFDYGTGGEWVPDLDISQLAFSATKNAHTTPETEIFTFTLGCSWTITGLQSFDFGDLQVDAAATLIHNAQNTPAYAGSSVSGTLDFHGLSLTVSATLGASPDYTFSFLGVTGTRDASGTITFTFANESLGSMVSMLVQAATGRAILLPEPWSALNDVSLNDFQLIFSAKTGTAHTVTLSCDIGLNIEIADIQSIELIYDCQTKNVHVGLTGSFLGQPMQPATYPGWVANDPSTAPSVPGKGKNFFELNLLGLGQHVALPSATSSMQQALSELRQTFSAPSVPSGLHYNQDAGWLIATQFTVLDMIELSILFNDPKLYGLLITVSKGKFNGLEFEVLYKKINANVGVYYIEFALPNYLRHMQFGAVSITLPDLGIWIYTNGGFKIDLGFPYNNDFSQSGGAQVLPFVGAGGFYFGELHGQTSSQLPAITHDPGGNFNPVIVFGLGLQLGLGKSINKGPISASIEITLEGILEGVIAPYHTYVSGGDGESVTYYYLEAEIGIVGVISGQLNLAIITANLSLVAQVTATAIIEAHRATDLSLVASATIEVSVRIDLWLFSITIHLHFDFEVTEQFTLGHNSLAPWQQGYLSGTNTAEYTADLNLIGVPAVTLPTPAAMNWQAPAPSNARRSMSLHFAPKFTLAGNAGERDVQVDALLLIDAPKAGGTMQAETSFTRLAEAVLLWMFNAALDPEKPLADIRDLELTHQDLLDIQSFIQRQDNGVPIHPISMPDLHFFFDNYVNIDLYSAIDIADPGNASFSVFPMLPFLRLTSPAGCTNFSDPLCSRQYFHDIRSTFEGWK
ncbi:hypothetical protein [Oceanibaculum nanhaiense]|uniref:hypothetical protein n=1 Tax=Oceanibaculum nanhaiense TaxID=1909734 RepID=UPI003F6EBAFD